MKIKINKDNLIGSFPYGKLSMKNKNFIIDFIGHVFEANLHNMNYYKINNGMLIHVYDATKIEDA